MRWFCDKTGFPFADCGRGLAIALLPTTKFQIERFLAEPGGRGKDWYEELLNLNPRQTWKAWTDRDREKLFLTGVRPAEAMEYCRWLGAGYDLPTALQWREARSALESAPLDRQSWELLQQSPLAPSARAVLDRARKILRPRTWAELALMVDGLIEWVRAGNEYFGLGKPRPFFFSVAINPEEELFRPLNQERFYYFGFRPVSGAPQESEESGL